MANGDASGPAPPPPSLSVRGRPFIRLRVDVDASEVALQGVVARGPGSTVFRGVFAGRPVAVKAPRLATTQAMDRYHTELELLRRARASARASAVPRLSAANRNATPSPRCRRVPSAQRDGPPQRVRPGCGTGVAAAVLAAVPVCGAFVWVSNFALPDCGAGAGQPGGPAARAAVAAHVAGTERGGSRVLAKRPRRRRVCAFSRAPPAAPSLPSILVTRRCCGTARSLPPRWRTCTRRGWCTGTARPGKVAHSPASPLTPHHARPPLRSEARQLPADSGVGATARRVRPPPSLVRRRRPL